MGGKTGGSANLLSIPKGGGALHGIGETFSADLHTGTANFSIPIGLPPGRNGFAPKISLRYSSGNGNGPFGLGWELDVPGVTRKTAKGVPSYDDSSDIFLLSGAEDLVPVERKESSTRYRPRTEGLFARITHHREVQLTGFDDYWEVKAKDGLVSVYGKPALPDGEPATVADPADRDNRIFAWKLTQTSDTFGNRIIYEYERDTARIGPRRWDQLYLNRIRYIDFDHAGAAKFLVSVTFVYDGDGALNASERPDAFSEYRPGFEVRTRRRCRRIEVRTHPDRDILVRTYNFSYLDEEVSASGMPLNGISLLSRIEVVGHDETQPPPTQALPPLVFDYTKFEPARRKFEVVTGDELPPSSLAHPDIEFVDLFGSGLPDLLEMNDVVRYWRNLGNGQFSLPRTMNSAPAGVKLADPGVQLIGQRTEIELAEALGHFGDARRGRYVRSLHNDRAVQEQVGHHRVNVVKEPIERGIP